jgi:dihydroorotate dehydrogenase
MGGVACVQDAVDFLACGARVVGVGCAGFGDPWLPGRVAADLGRELDRRRLDLEDLVGIAHKPQP